MIISLIAVIGKNNELGKANGLLWHLPNEMKYFKEKTSGHTIIMGRRTFESIGKPLPNRRNIVITRDKTYLRDGVDVVHSLEEALQLASLEQGKEFEENQEEIEVFVIGGGEIYKESIDRANRLYITRVDDNPLADTYFPDIKSEWKEVSKEKYERDEKNPYSYTTYVYIKTA